MANKLVGRNDVALGNVSLANVVVIAKFTAVVTGIITEIRCRVKASTAGNIILGIYADNANEPAALLATTASAGVSSGVERVITIALVANLSITSGTVYWIAFNSDADIIGDVTETCIKKYKALTYGALPNPAGTGYANDTTRNTIAAGWGIPASPVIFLSTPEGGKWTVPSGVTSVEVLVVAGGGGGGSGVPAAWEGGGGGGGGMVHHATKAVTPAAEVTITVGSGGATNTPGSDSIFDDITALGGGKGGSASIGGDGGSGGGGTYNGLAGGSATQGNSGGGTGYGNAGAPAGATPGGGGGGAGEAGNTDGDRQGGDGRNIATIDGNIYAGGGGGAGGAGVGGSGGGGAGRNGTNGVGTAGTPNTGGGGGGGYANTGTQVGGAGGSGIIVILYVGITEKTSSDSGSAVDAKSSSNPIILLTKVDTGVGADIRYDASPETITLRPNSAGDETALNYQEPTSGYHWEKVDEVAADDWTTTVYNFNQTTYLRDLYNIEDTSLIGTINWIKVWIRCAYNTNSAYAKTSIKTGGVTYDGIERSLTNSFVNYSTQYTINPQTGVAWTIADINALQIGVSLRCLYQEACQGVCTQVYVEVNYEVKSLTALFNRTELGIGIDASISQYYAKSVVDVGVGIDAKSLYPTVILTKNDVGAGVDSYHDVLRALFDIGIGIDLSVRVLFTMDTGIGSEVLSSLTATILKSDSGIGIETAHILAVLLLLNDACVGIDSAVLARACEDGGIGAESIALAAALSVAENWVGADTAIAGLTRIGQDSGIGIDAFMFRLYTLNRNELSTGRLLTAVRNKLVERILP